MIRVGERGEPVGDLGDGLPPRGLGGDGALFDETDGGADQFVGVVEQQEVGVEDGGLVIGRGERDPLPRRLQLAAGALHGGE